MKIIVDECIAESTIEVLKELGFEVLLIDSILHWGVEDEEIYEYASRHQISLITHDRRFGYIYLETSSNPSTIIILHIVSPHPEATNKLLRKALSQIDLKSRKYFGKLIIITPNKIRVRAKTF